MSDVNEFNLNVGEAVFRPYFDEELAQKEIDQNKEFEFDTISTPENTILVSALSKLQSLGLTIDEAKAIIGL
jgi:hypothetical protein